ncbi:MAG: Eco29kI family restriction endonuclease [Verrucomicrobiales bacterium]
MDDEDPFNPLDKRNLGKSVVEALLESPALPLSNVPSFRGAGVYAIYYTGDFEPYRPLAVLNRDGPVHPIYVGKAIPKGGRTGAASIATGSTRALSARLLEHKASVACVPGLAIGDFTYRRLVVDDIWISLAEALVIEKFTPLWNKVVDGFGNHDPGAGRYGGRRPLWDELHPGRPWAERCLAPRLPKEGILAAVSDYMKSLAGEVGQ